MSDPAVQAVQRISAVPTILRVITETTGLRLSLVAHVTDDAWTCCAVNDQLQFGLEVGGHLDVATTLCREVRAAQAPIVISHASADPTFCHHPTPKLYQFESYIAVPIFLPSGGYFGNVCALDSQPIDLTAPRTLAMFQLYAELIGFQLAAEARHDVTSAALLDAHATAELREQFIAVLGHDLRTPLTAISLGVEALNRQPLPATAAATARRIGRSAERIGRLVDDVVDFARGRLGSGIPLDPTPIDDITTVLRPVVDELRAAHPGRLIEVETRGTGPMVGDPVRLAQLLQNLLGNALVHSQGEAPVHVAIHLDADALRLRVANGGAALPAAVVARMFEPFHRGSAARPQGLGLGLYIASQIVHAHGGTLAVESRDDTVIMTGTVPRAPAPPAPMAPPALASS